VNNVATSFHQQFAQPANVRHPQRALEIGDRILGSVAAGMNAKAGADKMPAERRIRSEQRDLVLGAGSLRTERQVYE
jgi:hypothetical protein